MNTVNTERQFDESDDSRHSSYIYGRNAVIEALKAGARVEKIIMAFGAEGAAIDEIMWLARKSGTRIAETDRRKFFELERKIATSRGAAQGVIAMKSLIDALDVHTLIERAYEATDAPVLIALDGIIDPHNIGAIARSAECAGAQGMILPIERSSPVSPAAMKASAGALAYLPIAKAGTIEPALKDCKAAGFRIIGTDGNANKNYAEIDANEPVVIVIGGEGTGVSTSVRRICNEFVSIPTSGKINSLNASVAAGVILFRLAEKKRKSN